MRQLLEGALADTTNDIANFIDGLCGLLLLVLAFLTAHGFGNYVSLGAASHSTGDFQDLGRLLQSLCGRGSCLLFHCLFVLVIYYVEDWLGDLLHL